MSRSEWLSTSQATDYLRKIFYSMDTCYAPNRKTVYQWFARGYIQTLPHKRGQRWITTYDWIDEAIMWKKIPLKKKRLPLAIKVELAIDDKEYIATQEYLP